MKTQIVRSLSVALFAAATVFAQGSQTLRVQIPFGFHVGNSTLPAGEYTVDTLASGLLSMRSYGAGASVVTLTHPVQKVSAATDGKFVFHRYGDAYFLSQVWKRGENRGTELTKSRREYEATARAERAVETVIASK